MAGQALLEQLEAKGRAKSHLQTVESHLRNIFIKLGATSRVEVARMLERDG